MNGLSFGQRPLLTLVHVGREHIGVYIAAKLHHQHVVDEALLIGR